MTTNIHAINSLIQDVIKGLKTIANLFGSERQAEAVEDIADAVDMALDMATEIISRTRIANDMIKKAVSEGRDVTDAEVEEFRQYYLQARQELFKRQKS